ncbi:MAG: hypothetical protein LBH49_00335 [Puniceicoccales bacterium]|jgi:hypothetical protein|nr:hypothetical protein [Puniceicoccales bacterium]
MKNEIIIKRLALVGTLCSSFLPWNLSAKDYINNINIIEGNDTESTVRRQVNEEMIIEIVVQPIENEAAENQRELNAASDEVAENQGELNAAQAVSAEALDLSAEALDLDRNTQIEELTDNDETSINDVNAYIENVSALVEEIKNKIDDKNSDKNVVLSVLHIILDVLQKLEKLCTMENLDDGQIAKIGGYACLIMDLINGANVIKYADDNFKDTCKNIIPILNEFLSDPKNKLVSIFELISFWLNKAANETTSLNDNQMLLYCIDWLNKFTYNKNASDEDLCKILQNMEEIHEKIEKSAKNKAFFIEAKKTDSGKTFYEIYNDLKDTSLENSSIQADGPQD